MEISLCEWCRSSQREVWWYRWQAFCLADILQPGLLRFLGLPAARSHCPPLSFPSQVLPDGQLAVFGWTILNFIKKCLDPDVGQLWRSEVVPRLHFFATGQREEECAAFLAAGPPLAGEPLGLLGAGVVGPRVRVDAWGCSISTSLVGLGTNGEQEQWKKWQDKNTLNINRMGDTEELWGSLYTTADEVQLKAYNLTLKLKSPTKEAREKYAMTTFKNCARADFQYFSFRWLVEQ